MPSLASLKFRNAPRRRCRCRGRGALRNCKEAREGVQGGTGFSGLKQNITNKGREPLTRHLAARLGKARHGAKHLVRGARSGGPPKVNKRCRGCVAAFGLCECGVR